MTDAEWALIAELMPLACALREIVNAIFWALRGGISWRLLPKDMPPLPTVYLWFAWLRDHRAFERVKHALVTRDRELAGREASPRFERRERRLRRGGAGSPADVAAMSSPKLWIRRIGAWRKDAFAMIRFASAMAWVVTSGVAFADPAMTIHATTMRAAPSSHAHFVQRIPARAQIDVRDCREYWCAASWRDLDGYVRVDAIGANSGPLATRPPAYYGYGGPAFVGPVFGFGYYHSW